MTEHTNTPTQLSSIDELLKGTSNWVADRTPVDDDVRDALEHVAKNNTAKLSLLQQVLAMKKADVVSRLHATQDAIISQLLDPDQIRRIRDPNLLIKLGQLTKELLRDGEAFIERRCGEGVDPAVHSLLDRMKLESNQGDVAEQIRALSPQKRELMRKVLDPLRQQLSNRNQVLTQTPTGVDADEAIPAVECVGDSDALGASEQEVRDLGRNGHVNLNGSL